jgi:hypothetical protein
MGYHHQHSNSWAGFGRTVPIPSPPLSLYTVEIDPAHIRHAAATSFQRDLYNIRTKDKNSIIPDAYTSHIEVLDVQRLINRPEALTVRLEFPTSVRHLRLKNTQIDITGSLRSASAVQSVTQFLDLPWGKTTVAFSPCHADELVLNLTYTPQRPCHLDACGKFGGRKVTVILTPTHPTVSGPHKMLLQDIQNLVASIALQTQGEGVVATIVADGLAPLKWEMPDRRGGLEHTARYLRLLGDKDPNAAVEIVDLKTYAARVGEDVAKRHTVW